MKYYLSVCKNIIAQNRKLPQSKQIPPIRLSRGKYGKPKHLFSYSFPMGATIKFNEKPMPWGARVWIEWDV